jgi:hypothetical protein
MRCYNIQQQSSVLVLIPRVSLRFVLSLAEIGDHVILLALPVSQIYKFFTAALFTETEFFIRIPFTWISVFCFFCSYVPRHFQYGRYLCTRVFTFANTIRYVLTSTIFSRGNHEWLVKRKLKRKLCDKNVMVRTFVPDPPRFC